MTDPISDMLVRIKNAQAVNAERVLLPASKVKFRIATILKDAGYLAAVDKRKKKTRKAEHDYLELTLHYTDGVGAVSGVKIVSRPSRHIYVNASEIKPVRSGFGIAIVSTSQGILSSKEARKQKIGGELMFEIW